MSAIDDLIARLEDAWGDLPEDQREIAKGVAQDLAQLQGRALLGEEVEDELAIAKASALNLSVAASRIVQETFIEWLGSTARQLIGGALPLP